MSATVSLGCNAVTGKGGRSGSGPSVLGFGKGGNLTSELCWTGSATIPTDFFFLPPRILPKIPSFLLGLSSSTDRSTLRDLSSTAFSLGWGNSGKFERASSGSGEKAGFSFSGGIGLEDLVSVFMMAGKTLSSLSFSFLT